MTESCSNTTSGEWKLPKNMTAEKKRKDTRCYMLATFVIDIIGFTRSLSDATVGYAMFVV